ncbi:unnamed protein product [Symbiodinium sp. CCMP2592]|nr:unnamed protein product [Symbiodinium sp. CCMP2592]
MASCSEPNSVMTIRAMRLNGEMLELKLSDSDLADLRTVRDLKKRLAAADPSSPCVRLVRLVGPNGDLQDDELLSMADLAEGCELQYILTSWMSLPEIQEVLGDLVVPEGVWPNADERHQPWTLLAEPVADLANQIAMAAENGSRVFDFAWADALLSRPIARVFAETPSMLTDMFAFGLLLDDSEFVLGTFHEVAKQVVALVEPETVQRCFATPNPETQKLLWESVRKKEPYRGRGSAGGCKAADCFCELLKKGLPRWCWAGSIPPFEDNLLQYILEPNCSEHPRHREDKDSAQGRLCIAVAERLTLEELCYQNSDGRSALNYAGSNPFIPGEAHIWKVVRDAIKDNMVHRFRTETRPVQDLTSMLHTLQREAHAHGSGDADEDYEDVIASWDEHLRSLTADGLWLDECGGDVEDEEAEEDEDEEGNDVEWTFWTDHGTALAGGPTAGTGMTIDLVGKEAAVLPGSRKHGNPVSDAAAMAARTSWLQEGFCCLPPLLLKCCCHFSSNVQERDKWKKFGARIMASFSEPNSVMTIRAMRLNGELLELKLSDSELADLRTVRDLKVRLAAADPSSPCPLDCHSRSPYLLLDSKSKRYRARLVRLVGPDGDLRDDEPLPMADLANGCELQYILTSWMALPEIRKALGGKVIPEGVWPNADERHQPWTLLAEPVARLERQIFIRRGDLDSSLVLRDAWADALLSRPIARVFAETPSMLTDMFAFGRHLEESRLRGALCWLDKFREVAEHVVALVEPETVQRCFATPNRETQKLLWESVRKKKPQRGTGKLGGWGSAGCFCELLKKGLPRWCWAGSIPPFHDSLLQYILEPTFRQHSQHFADKDEAQGRLCIAVAERLTLEELCYQNSGGRSALHYAIECVPSYYAIQCVPNFANHPSMHIWKEVRDVIKDSMVQRFRAETRPVQSLSSALQGLQREARAFGLQDYYDDDDNYCHFHDVIVSFDEHRRSLTGEGCLPSLTPAHCAGAWRSRGQDAWWPGYHGSSDSSGWWTDGWEWHHRSGLEGGCGPVWQQGVWQSHEQGSGYGRQS